MHRCIRQNYVPAKRQATVLRYDRVGGRFWYKMPDAFTPDSTVYIGYTDDAAAGGKGHLTVTAETSKNFELTKLKIRNSGSKDDLALIEIVA